MSGIQELKNENKMLLKEIDRLKDLLERSEYWQNKDNLNQLTIRATNQAREIEELKGRLKVAEHFNDQNNIHQVTIRATSLGIKLEKQEKENVKLKEEIQKLKSENKLLKEKKGVSSTKSNKVKNERGAGRKAKFTEQDRETIKLYRIQGKTIKEIAEMYSCSVGLIHKIINE